MQLEPGASLQDYAESLVSLHARWLARVRIVHEMEGVEWNDDFVGEYWPDMPIGEDPYPYPNAIAWALRLDADTLHGARLDDSFRSWEQSSRWYRMHSIPPSPSFLLRVIAASIISSPSIYSGDRVSAYQRDLYDWDRNPLWSGWGTRRGFVHPETHEPFSNNPWARVETLESLIGEALPEWLWAPVSSGNFYAWLRRGDARVINWLHRALDYFYVVKIPEGARVCNVRDYSKRDLTYSYEPTVTFRQYQPNSTLPETRPLREFEWPWYHPIPEGGVQRTTMEPAPVTVEQRAHRVWDDDDVTDPWVRLMQDGELLNSGNPTHGWYYRFEGLYNGQYYSWFSRELMLPPFDRRHASWRQYQRAEEEEDWGITPHYRYRRYAEVNQSWYRSTLEDMERWPEVEDIVEYWEWDIRCYHNYFGIEPITFWFETDSESYAITLEPGDDVTERLRFTAPVVHMHIGGQAPSTTPFPRPWGSADPWIGTAASFCNAVQRRLPDLFRDIREQLGETPAD